MEIIISKRQNLLKSIYITYMDSVEQTLRRARQIDQKYKQFLIKKETHDKSIQQTMKKIDKTQATLEQTKQTIGSIDKIYQRLQEVLSSSIDAAIKSIEKNTLLTVPEIGWEPTYVDPKKIAVLLKASKKILVLTGAGMSAGSGIPTFRGQDGFWSKQTIQYDPNDPNSKLEPQIILTQTFYHQHPAVTWKWLRDFYQLKLKCKPNKGHFALSQILEELKDKNKDVCIVSQNIDNFHIQTKQQRKQKNKKFKDYPIYEIHGNITKIRCNHCSIEQNKLYQQPYEHYVYILQQKSRLFCRKCEGPLRPHIMFFDQTYDEVINRSDTVNQFVNQADVVISIGTALQTGLANSVISKALNKGAQVIEINPACVIKKQKVWWLEGKSEEVLQKIRFELLKL